jgi:glycerophosphoryl diester phosphodiesterase
VALPPGGDKNSQLAAQVNLPIPDLRASKLVRKAWFESPFSDMELVRNDARAVICGSRPLVIAHRGYSVVAPENSLAAFRHALAAGVDLVELDYHHSFDGIPMVIHDTTLDRTTNASVLWGETRLKVCERSAAELKTLSNGRWFKPPYPESKVPTLKQALAVIQDRSMALIEQKSGDAATCLSLLRQGGWAKSVVVQSFDWEYLRNLRRLDSQLVLGALGPALWWEGRRLKATERDLSVSWLDEIIMLGAQLVVWNSQVNAASVKAAHRRGLKVWIYTVDEPSTAKRLLEVGVDGLISNNPALIWKCLGRNSD